MTTRNRIILGSLALLAAGFLFWKPDENVTVSFRQAVPAAAPLPGNSAGADAAPGSAGEPKPVASSTAQAAPSSVAVSAEEKHSIAAQIHAARRWFAQTLREDGGAALVASVDGPAGFAFEADARGVEVQPHGGAAWTWKMKPADGRPAAPRADKQRLSCDRGAGVTEWFVNGEDGIEHGYTLAAENGTAVRKVSTVVETGLLPLLRTGRDGVDFLDESGATQLHYDGLLACDAAGRTLESWIELHNQSDRTLLTLAVNTDGARFPVTIDPVISLAGAAIQPSPVEAADAFATDMEVVGDLLIAGAPERNVPGNAEGAVFIFRRDTGCAFGWSQAAGLNAPVFAQPQMVRAFGKKTAFGGNTLAVACERDGTALGVIDEVRLYTLDAAGATTPLSTLFIGQNLAGHHLSLDVSADGGTVAVGSTSHYYNQDPGQPQTGRVLVFGRDEGGANNWGLAAALQPPAATAGAGFGASLSLSGNLLAVGAPGISNGRAFAYTRSGSVWTLEETFTPPAVTAPVTVEGFGKAVSLQGTWLAIGAPDSDGGAPGLSGINTGRVIVAERNAPGEWSTGSLLPVASSSGGAGFGSVLSMSASQLSIAGTNASALWRRSNSSSPDAAEHWVLEQEDSLASLGLSGAITALRQFGDVVLTGSAAAGKIVARRQVVTNWPAVAHFSEGSAGHLAGAALARDGDLLAIGAPGDTATRDRSVYILRRNTGAAPGQEWTLAHTFTDNSGGFGSSLALKDGILLIGAPGIGNGVALSYRRQNAAATSWGTPQLLVAPVTFPAAAFGTAIAFNGVFAVVGDPQANGGIGGAVVFQRPASGEWPVVMGGTALPIFRGYGAAVAITEANHFIVGAPQTDDVSIPDGGAAVVWRYQPATDLFFNDGSVWTPAWSLDQHLFPDGSLSERSNGRFGASVAMHGQHALIGAPGDGTASQHGRVFVFRRDESPLPPADPVPTQVPWRKTQTLFAGNLTDNPPDAPFFGHALALNAAHVVIGAPGDATHAGQVFVYSAASSGILWAPIARMLEPASAPGDGFGSALAAPIMDEIAAGAPGRGVGIFEKQRSEWRRVRNMPAQTQVFSNILPVGGWGEGPLAVGAALAMDGDWLVVGAPRVYHTTSTGVAPVVSVTDPWKQVFVLHRRSQAGLGSDAWETTTVLAFGGNTWSYGTSMNHNRTGLSVDISGRNVIVGQGSNVDNGGIARIARLQADGTQPQVELTPDGYLLSEGYEMLQTEGGSGLTGHAVSISGGYAAVGNGGGGVHIYEWRGWHDPQLVGGGLEGTRQWKLVRTLERSPFEARGFGSAVALDGVRLAVGADQHRNEGGGSDGMVMIFERDLGGANNWGLRRELTLPHDIAEEGAYFGMGAALALEGDTLVAGAHGSASEGYSGLPNGNVRTFGTGGTALVFERHAGGFNNWGLTAWLYGTDSIGVSVAISGDIIALGSPGGVFEERQQHPQIPSLYNLIGPYYQRGKVTLFHRREAKTGGAVESAIAAWGEIAAFEQENAATTHSFNFGAAVALSGSTLAIGAPGTIDGPTPGYRFNDDNLTLTPGRAFVHDLRLTGTQQWRDVWLPDVIAPAGGVTPYSGTFNPNGLDFDGDGLTNTLEQFHGLNPFIADARHGGLLTTALNAGDLVLTWREALNHGLTAVPQWSRSLAPWHNSGTGPSAGDVKTFTVTTVSTHADYVIKQARVPVAGEAIFFARLAVTE